MYITQCIIVHLQQLSYSHVIQSNNTPCFVFISTNATRYSTSSPIVIRSLVVRRTQLSDPVLAFGTVCRSISRLHSAPSHCLFSAAAWRHTSLTAIHTHQFSGIPVAGASCRQTNRTCAILKPTGNSDWHQWNSGTSGMTHTPVYWCKLTGTGYWYQKTGQCVWPFRRWLHASLSLSYTLIVLVTYWTFSVTVIRRAWFTDEAVHDVVMCQCELLGQVSSNVSQYRMSTLSRCQRRCSYASKSNIPAITAL